MQQMRPEERREFQRLHLSDPINATLQGDAVTIHEIGVLGARIMQPSPVQARQPDLRFKYKGREIVIGCELVHIGRNLESGLRFIAAAGDSALRLREMLGELVIGAINARRRPSDTMLQLLPLDGERTLSGKDAGFIAHRFENGQWTKRSVFLPEQPASGFTLARVGHENEVERLRRAYETADDEGRRLIRVFAELSVSEVLRIPPAV